MRAVHPSHRAPTPQDIKAFSRFARLGDRARDQRSWPVAVAYYEEAVRIDPSRAAYWVQYGHALKESGEPLRAEAAYRQALALEPDNADTHLNLGHLLKILGRPNEALASYTQADKLAPHDEATKRELVALHAAQ